MLRGENSWPEWRGLVVAFVTCLLFFLRLRIADEFKDFEEDSRYRPYRPVPRGLVTLRELGWVGVGAAVIQLALAVWLAPFLIIVLLAGWAYLALMSHEFFAREWLKARPVTLPVDAHVHHADRRPLCDGVRLGACAVDAAAERADLVFGGELLQRDRDRDRSENPRAG